MSPLNTGPRNASSSKGFGCGSSGECGAEGPLAVRVLSVDFCLSNLSMSSRAVSLSLSNSFCLLFAFFSSSSRCLTEAMTASTMSSTSSPNTDPASPLSVVGVGGRCIESTIGDFGVVGPEGTSLAKWTSKGLTHGFALPLEVPGRDPTAGPGPARLVEDPLFAPNRAPNPGAGAARLVEDPLFAPKRAPKPGAGPARLAEDPLVVPNRVRMFASEAWGLRTTLAWLPERTGPEVVKSAILATAILWVSRLVYGVLALRIG